MISTDYSNRGCDTDSTESTPPIIRCGGGETSSTGLSYQICVAMDL